MLTCLFASKPHPPVCRWNLPRGVAYANIHGLNASAWFCDIVSPSTEREFCIDNLLVRIHLIIEMVLVHRPCAMGV